jgi:hypothetical protein
MGDPRKRFCGLNNREFVIRESEMKKGRGHANEAGVKFGCVKEQGVRMEESWRVRGL